MKYSNNSYENSEEIDIKEMLNILKQQKKIMIGVFIICLLISIAAVWITKPVYESRAVIAIGQVPQTHVPQTHVLKFVLDNNSNQIQQGYIEEPLMVVQRLKEGNQVNDLSVVLSVVEIDKKAANNVITLKANGDTAEETQIFLNNIVSQIVREHDEIYNGALVAHQQRLLTLGEQIKNIDIEIDNYKNILKTNRNINDSLNLLIVLEKSKAESQKIDIEKQLVEEKLTINLQLKPTKVFREATLPIAPLKSKPIIAIGAIMGLILGVMVSYTRHTLAKRVIK